jgi:hypothetical protein
MHNEIMPHFIRQEGGRWQIVFCFGFGEGGGEKTGLNARNSF